MIFKTYDEAVSVSDHTKEKKQTAKLKYGEVFVYTPFSKQNLVSKCLHCRFYCENAGEIYSYFNENQYCFCS